MRSISNVKKSATVVSMRPSAGSQPSAASALLCRRAPPLMCFWHATMASCNDPDAHRGLSRAA